MKRRLIALLVLIAVVLAACGSSGNPETFDDQPGPLPDSIAQFANDLVGTANPDTVPLVERNFLEGCMLDGTARLGNLSGAALARACGCSYDGLVSFLIDNPPPDQTAFETFVELDKSLRDENDSLSSVYTDIFDGCGLQEA